MNLSDKQKGLLIGLVIIIVSVMIGLLISG
jgi:hypothetical protein